MCALPLDHNDSWTSRVLPYRSNVKQLGMEGVRLRCSSKSTLTSKLMSIALVISSQKWGEQSDPFSWQAWPRFHKQKTFKPKTCHSFCVKFSGFEFVVLSFYCTHTHLPKFSLWISYKAGYRWRMTFWWQPQPPRIWKEQQAWCLADRSIRCSWFSAGLPWWTWPGDRVYFWTLFWWFLGHYSTPRQCHIQ